MVCPKCTSENVDKLHSVQSDMTIKITIRCLFCEATWRGKLYPAGGVYA